MRYPCPRSHGGRGKIWHLRSRNLSAIIPISLQSSAKTSQTGGVPKFGIVRSHRDWLGAGGGKRRGAGCVFWEACRIDRTPRGTGRSGDKHRYGAEQDAARIGALFFRASA